MVFGDANCEGRNDGQVTETGMDPLEKLKQLALPFAELIGVEFVEAAADRVVAEMTVREDLCTRPAVMHGGAIMAFADTLGAAGTILNLPEGDRKSVV